MRDETLQVAFMVGMSILTTVALFAALALAAHTLLFAHILVFGTAIGQVAVAREVVARHAEEIDNPWELAVLLMVIVWSGTVMGWLVVFMGLAVLL